MLGKFALDLQKRRINGLFSRVLYIDPYPNKLVKYPSFLGSNLLILFGILCFPFAWAIGYAGTTENISRDFDISLVIAAGEFVYSTIGEWADLFSMERIEILGWLLPAILLIGIISVLMASWVSKRLVVRRWYDRCEKTKAILLDSEIQEQLIATGSEDKTETRFVFRIKVQFRYQGQNFDVTPSVVNRLTPGSVGLTYKTPEECEAKLRLLGQSVKVEFDPQQPLDCEISGYLEELLQGDKYPWLPAVIFGGALFLFGQLFVLIMKNQG